MRRSKRTQNSGNMVLAIKKKKKKVTFVGVGKKEYIDLDDVAELKDYEIVEVNTNRIYCRLAEMSAKGTKGKDTALLREKARSAQAKNQMYMKMKAGDILKCFPKGEELPANSFRGFMKK